MNRLHSQLMEDPMATSAGCSTFAQSPAAGISEQSFIMNQDDKISSPKIFELK